MGRNWPVESVGLILLRKGKGREGWEGREGRLCSGNIALICYFHFEHIHPKSGPELPENVRDDNGMICDAGKSGRRSVW